MTTWQWCIVSGVGGAFVGFYLAFLLYLAIIHGKDNDAAG